MATKGKATKAVQAELMGAALGRLDDRPIRIQDVAAQIAAARIAGMGGAPREERARVILESVDDAGVLVSAVDTAGLEPAAVPAGTESLPG